MPPTNSTAPLGVFGARVRAFRLERGLTQEALAHASGLHPTYIGGIERGERNLSLLNVLKVADGLGVDPGDLLEGLGT